MKKEMLEALSSRYPGKAIKAYMNSIGWTRVVNSFVLDMGSTVEILSHKQGRYEKRQSISQPEFEAICREVLSRRPNIIDCWFEEPGIVHVVYPSHSGKTKNGATLYFGEKGYITYAGWRHSTGSNEGIFIGEEISRRIQCALYE